MGNENQTNLNSTLEIKTENVRTLLIIDDEPDIGDILKEIFQKIQ